MNEVVYEDTQYFAIGIRCKNPTKYIVFQIIRRRCVVAILDLAERNKNTIFALHLYTKEEQVIL